MHKPFKLDVNDPRKELIFRMQAWAYSNVSMGMMKQCEDNAGYALERFDAMIADKPTDSAGYWSNFYFDRFVQDCEKVVK